MAATRPRGSKRKAEADSTSRPSIASSYDAYPLSDMSAMSAAVPMASDMHTMNMVNMPAAPVPTDVFGMPASMSADLPADLSAGLSVPGSASVPIELGTLDNGLSSLGVVPEMPITNEMIMAASLALGYPTTTLDGSDRETNDWIMGRACMLMSMPLDDVSNVNIDLSSMPMASASSSTLPSPMHSSSAMYDSALMPTGSPVQPLKRSTEIPVQQQHIPHTVSLPLQHHHQQHQPDYANAYNQPPQSAPPHQQPMYAATPAPHYQAQQSQQPQQTHHYHPQHPQYPQHPHYPTASDHPGPVYTPQAHQSQQSPEQPAYTCQTNCQPNCQLAYSSPPQPQATYPPTPYQPAHAVQSHTDLQGFPPQHSASYEQPRQHRQSPPDVYYTYHPPQHETSAPPAKSRKSSHSSSPGSSRRSSGSSSSSATAHTSQEPSCVSQPSPSMYPPPVTNATHYYSTPTAAPASAPTLAPTSKVVSSASSIPPQPQPCLAEQQEAQPAQPAQPQTGSSSGYSTHAPVYTDDGGRRYHHRPSPVPDPTRPTSDEMIATLAKSRYPLPPDYQAMFRKYNDKNITVDDIAQGKVPCGVNDYQTRLRNLEDFCRMRILSERLAEEAREKAKRAQKETPMGSVQ